MADNCKIDNKYSINSQYDAEQYVKATNATDNTQAVNSVMNQDSSISSYANQGTTLETSISFNEDSYEQIKKDLENKIKQKKQELSDTKKNRGWLSSIGNGISEVFGGGDSSKEKEIENLETQLNSLEKNPENISSVYKNITGKDLDTKTLSSLEESNSIVKNLSADQNKQIQELLNNQYQELENQLKDTKNENGWISGGWDKFKNWAGVGASSNKTQTQLDNMKKELDDIKNNPENLAQAYKNITGKDLNNEELTKLASGEVSLTTSSKASDAVKKYSDGQKMATDVVADIVSGIVAVGAIALAPFTGGGSLLLAAGVGAALKVGIKWSDTLGSSTKTYGLKDLGYDAVTGSINGLMAPVSNGLGGVVGTGVAKTLGLEAVESTAKTAMTQAAKTAGKEVIEETLEQTTKQAGKGILTKVLAKQGSEYILKEGADATAKTFFAKTAAYGADMMVDGALSGATDGFARDLATGNLENMGTDIVNGAIGGTIASPIIGGGFRVAGKTGSKIGNKLFDNAEKEISENISDKVSKDISQGVTNEDSTLAFGSLTKSLKSPSEEIIDSSALEKELTNSGEFNLGKPESEQILSDITNSNTIFKPLSNSEIPENPVFTGNIASSTPNKKQLILSTNPKNEIAQLKETAIKTDHMATDIEMPDNLATGETPELASKGELTTSQPKQILSSASDSNTPSKSLSEDGIQVNSTSKQSVITSKDGKEIVIATNPEDRIVQLKELGINYDYLAEEMAALDEKQYTRVVELLDKGVSNYNVQDIAKLDDKQYTRIVDLLDKGVDNYSGKSISELDDKQYGRCIELLDKGVQDYNAKAIAELDDNQYAKCFDLLNKDVDSYTAKEIAQLDDKQYGRCIELLDKNVDSFNVKNYAELDDKQYARLVELLDKDVDGYDAKKIIQLDDKQYDRHVELLDKGVSTYDIRTIAKLDDKQYERCVQLLDKGIDGYTAKNIVELNDEQYERCIQLLDKKIDGCAAKEIAELEDKQYERCIELLDKGADAYYVKEIVQIDDKQYEKLIELLDKKMNLIDAYSYATLDEMQGQRYADLLDKGIAGPAAKEIAQLDADQYQKCIKFMDKGVSAESAFFIKELDDSQCEKFVDLLNKKVEINNPQAILGLDPDKYSQLISLADEMQNIKIDDYDGKNRFFNCDELIEIINDDYCKSNIIKLKSKGDIKIGELNKIIAASRLMKNSSLSGKEQDFVKYANSIDYEKLSAIAPDIDKFTVDNFESFLNYHFKNATTDFTQESLKYNGEFSKLLTENLMNATELSKILSAFPNTNRNIGSIPKDWISSPSEEITTKIYNVINDFNSLVKSNKVNIETSTSETDNLASELSKILGKKVKAKYLGSGSLGDAIKLEIEGAEPVVFKTFKTVPNDVEHLNPFGQGWKDAHGAGNEPQAGLYAKENQIKNFAEFYFGKVANSNDSDGFMVTKFLSQADNAESFKTTSDKLNLNYMVSLDDHSGNLIDGMFIDYGAVKTKKDISRESFDLATKIVNDTMDYTNKLKIQENINLNEYLNRLEKTPEIGEKQVSTAIEFLIQDYQSEMNKKLKNQLDDWLKKHNN